MIYEYICEQCQILETNENLEPPKCFHCDQPMKQKYSLSGISFKGNGFYKTDKTNHVG